MSKNRKSGHFFEIFKFILSRDVPGQRSLSRDICSCPCPGTKGHRDKKIFLSRDKGTTGRPVETLVHSSCFVFFLTTYLLANKIWSVTSLYTPLIRIINSYLNYDSLFLLSKLTLNINY